MLLKRIFIFTVLLLFIKFNAFAAGTSISDNGFDCTIYLGAQIVTLNDNMVYGVSSFIRFYDKDIKRNDWNASAEINTIVIPFVEGKIAYNFESNTKIFIHSESIESFRNTDTGLFLGISQEKIKNFGNIGISGIYGVPYLTWEDPYTEVRKTTKSGCFGGLAEWGNIFGSGFNLNYMYRTLTIEDEESGEGMGLSSLERDLLNRKGNHHKAGMEYKFFIDNHTNIFQLGFDYDMYDYRGDAMSFNRYSVNAGYTYISQSNYIVKLSALYGFSKNSEVNPLFGKTIKTNRYGGQITFVKNQIFNEWNLAFSIHVYVDDANQNFYDSGAKSVSLALLHHI